MNELIKIEMNENQEIIVSGRELHKGLGVESRYNDWFKRMLKYGFEENLDYIAITQKKVTAQGNETTYIDHVIKLDMAKEICMLQRNDKGREFRKYFIECEKRLKEQQLPQLTRKEELQLQLFSEDSLEVVNAHKELVKIEVEEATKPLLGKIEEDKPKVDVYERFINSDFTYTATSLKGIFGFPSAVAMNKKLHELKLIYKPGNSKKWTAYKDTPKEWYKVLATEFGDTLRWSSKGVLGIADLLDIKISEGDIENLIEKDE